MPKTHKRHKNSSFQRGDLVEYIGVDRLNRGVGVVLEEVPYDGIFLEETDDGILSCLRIYWQNLGREETLHKARVKRIAEVTKILPKKEKTIKDEQKE
jgi:hypothetical protein